MIPSVEIFQAGKRWKWIVTSRHGHVMAISPRSFKTRHGAYMSLRATWRVMNRVVGKAENK